MSVRMCKKWLLVYLKRVVAWENSSWWHFELKYIFSYAWILTRHNYSIIISCEKGENLSTYMHHSDCMTDTLRATTWLQTKLLKSVLPNHHTSGLLYRLCGLWEFLWIMCTFTPVQVSHYITGVSFGTGLASLLVWKVGLWLCSCRMILACSLGIVDWTGGMGLLLQPYYKDCNCLYVLFA